MKETTKARVVGHVKIKDDLGQIILDKKNAIHYENFSVALAKSLAGDPEGHIQEIHFGSGGSNITGDGTITYLPPNVVGFDASLYNPTYYKVVNQYSNLNFDPSVNNVSVRHTIDTGYSDVSVKCVLEFNEPAGQEAFDNSTTTEGEFIFDEIGLKSYNPVPGAGLLLTHVIFNPIQKSLNRQYEIEYTLRIEMD